MARFRVNAFTSNRGPAAVFHAVPSTVLTLEDLKAPRIFQKIADHPRGLVLVTGPTGSGKSTTLAAMINYINATQPSTSSPSKTRLNLYTKAKKPWSIQRELRNTPTTANALRSALREDPDVILIGEMRDPETISLALTAAKTAMVFGTLHHRCGQNGGPDCGRVPPAKRKYGALHALRAYARGNFANPAQKTRDGNGRVTHMKF